MTAHSESGHENKKDILLLETWFQSINTFTGRSVACCLVIWCSVHINSWPVWPGLACFLDVCGDENWAFVHSSPGSYLLALPCRHCREKHWFPLHKCFFLVPGSEGPASIVMCSHVHMCACASACVRKAVKTLPYKHVCVLWHSKSEARDKDSVLYHYGNRPNAAPVVKYSTPANTSSSSSSSRPFFFLFF